MSAVTRHTWVQILTRPCLCGLVSPLTKGGDRWALHHVPGGSAQQMVGAPPRSSRTLPLLSQLRVTKIREEYREGAGHQEQPGACLTSCSPSVALDHHRSTGPQQSPWSAKNPRHLFRWVHLKLPIPPPLPPPFAAFPQDMQAS